jgi:hypothetical protein
MSIIHFYNIDLILALTAALLLASAVLTFAIWRLTKRLVHKIL